MELLQIIIFTLKLFALTSAIVVLISYFIFKLKDRTRLKPYMRPTLADTSAIAIQIEKQNVEKTPERFKIINEENSFMEEHGFNSDKLQYKNKSYNRFSDSNLVQAKENFDIYDHYSNSSFEPMHKIRM